MRAVAWPTEHEAPSYMGMRNSETDLEAVDMLHAWLSLTSGCRDGTGLSGTARYVSHGFPELHPPSWSETQAVGDYCGTTHGEVGRGPLVDT